MCEAALTFRAVLYFQKAFAKYWEKFVALFVTPYTLQYAILRKPMFLFYSFIQKIKTPEACNIKAFRGGMEQVTGIEPVCSAWKAIKTSLISRV